MKEITLIGEVGYEITLDRVRMQVNDSENIKINIFSVGGSVVEGLAIYDFLKQKNVEFVVEGLVASIATVITCAGKVEMGEGFFMVHDPFGLAMGTQEEMETSAEVLKKMKKKINQIYQKKTGMSETKIKNLMSKESWMDAEEAYENGFIDSVIDYDSAIANSMNLDKFNISVGAKNYAASALLKEDKKVIEDLSTQEAEDNFQHTSKTNEEDEPQWGEVDKKELPVEAHAYEAENTDTELKTTWKYPHHWIQGASQFSEKGVAENGTMYLHTSGLGYAWAAAQGARTGEKASQEIRDHLEAHREDLGLEEEDCVKIFDNINQLDNHYNKGVNMKPEDQKNGVDVKGILSKLDEKEKAYFENLTETKDELSKKLESMSNKVDELLQSKNDAETKLEKREMLAEMKEKYPNVDGVDEYLDLYMTEDENLKAKIEKMLDGLNTKRQAGDTDELGSNDGAQDQTDKEEVIKSKAKEYQKEGLNYADAYVKAYKEINKQK